MTSDGQSKADKHSKEEQAMSDSLDVFSKELKPYPFCGSKYVRLFLGPGVTFIAGCEDDECGCQTLPFAYPSGR